MKMDFGAAFDRERDAWRNGHGGDERGYAVEGEAGQQLRWAWEEADYTLATIWDCCSRVLQPWTRPDMVLADKVIRGGSG